MVPWPEIMITSGGLSSWRILSRVSRPSMPGSQMSSSTTSKAPLRRRSRQASPLSADEAEYPSSVSTPANESRIPASSSTMRMLGMLNTCSGGNNLGNDWQLYNEPGTDWLVFFNANGAMVLLDDATYDRQAQSRATPLGGKIRQEKLLFEFAGHSMTGVRDGDLHHVARRHQCGRNVDLTHQ